jgi:hypothetical protein
MRHGDEIQILVDGASIRPKSLEPIGITHRSQCWGIWLEPRQKEHDYRPPEDGLDFIISPIHPSLWPFAFRVESSMNSQPGTLRSLSRQLVVDGVNVLYLDHSPGGYTHSSFTAICTFDYDHEQEMFKTFERMERRVGRLRRLFSPPAIDKGHYIKEHHIAISKLRTHYFRMLGVQMLAQLAGLWAKLRNEERAQYEFHKRLSEGHQGVGKDIFFLASRIVEQGLEPWFLRILDPDGKLNKPDEPYRVPETDDGEEHSAEELMAEILNTTYSGGDGRTKGETIDKLLTALKRTHWDTRYGPVDKGPLTVQSKLAHLKDEHWKRHLLGRIAWRHAHLPLTVQALVRLAEMRFWMAPYDPIEFHYNADSCLLEPTSKDQFRDQVTKLGRAGRLRPHQPIWALATYYHEDRFVRLRFMPQSTARKRVRIEIRFDIPGQVAPDPHFDKLHYKPARTKELIANVAAEIIDREGDVLRVTNSTGTFDPNTGAEVGEIHFAVEFKSALSKEERKDLSGAIKFGVDLTINNPRDVAKTFTRGKIGIGQPAAQPGNVLPRAKVWVRITPFERDRVFVSTVFSHGRIAEFRRILDGVAARFGLQTVYANTNTEGVRVNVHNQVAHCRYFLQIVTAREDDQTRMRDDPTYIPDFTWVTYELGCAVTYHRHHPERRCVRMIDDLLSGLARARLDLTGGDIAPIRFRIDDSPKKLREHFTKAVVALLGDQ